MPINIDKLQSIYNNLDDTILLLDNNHNMNEILKNRFYQMHFIKNNYENILNNFQNVSGLEDQIELINDQLLKYDDIKIYLLRLRFLDLLLKNEEMRIYEPNLNYELLTPFSNELSKKLSDLIKYKTKLYFIELCKYVSNMTSKEALSDFIKKHELLKLKNQMLIGIYQTFVDNVSDILMNAKYYNEIDDKTFELEVSRNYKGSASMGLDKCINYQDMSIITGLDLSAFEPWGNPMIGSLIPWSDGMVYCPDQVFEDLYIRHAKK